MSSVFIDRLLSASRSGEVLQLASTQVEAADLRQAALAGEADAYGLRLAGARIIGTLDLRAVRVPVPLVFTGCEFTEPLLIEGAELHELVIEDGSVPRISGNGVRIARDLVLSGTTAGEIRLRGAAVRGEVRFVRSVLTCPGGTALDLSQATLGAGLELGRARIQGSITLAYARISGPAGLRGTALSDPLDDVCVRASGVRIEGDLWLNGLTATGGAVNFRNATIAGALDAEGAEIVNPGGRTLSLQQIQVQANIRICGGFRSVGVVVLTRADIGGRLRCDGATLRWEPGAGPPLPATGSWPNELGSAIELISATIGGGIDLGWNILAGGVDFTDASTTYLADDPERDWPEQTRLGGFRYERYAATERRTGVGIWDAGRRIAWLAGMRPYDPRAWEQAAKVLRAGGDQYGADRILIAQRRHARRTRAFPQSPWGRAGNAVLDGTVGYGYRPQRALLILLGLILVVFGSVSLPAGRETMRTTDQQAVVYTVGEQCGDGHVRCFNAFFYAVDTVVPIINLNQRSTWYPSPGRPGGTLLAWWLNVCTILGWIASTIFALSFTRLGRG
jgi:hypothetical protein